MLDHGSPTVTARLAGWGLALIKLGTAPVWATLYAVGEDVWSGSGRCWR